MNYKFKGYSEDELPATSGGAEPKLPATSGGAEPKLPATSAGSTSKTSTIRNPSSRENGDARRLEYNETLNKTANSFIGSHGGRNPNDIKKPCPYCATKISKNDCIPFFRAESIQLKNIVGDKVLGESQRKAVEVYRRHFQGGHADGTTDIEVPEGLFLFPEVVIELNKTGARYEPTERKITFPPGQNPLIASDPLVCKHCGQFIPREYWNLDCVGIALYGSPKVGKTAYFCSLLDDNCKQLSRGVNGFAKNLLTGSMVGITHVIDSALDGWAEGKLPPPTNGNLPPIFIKITWPKKNDEEKPYEQLLYIIDQSGEESEDDKRIAEIIVSQCDGILYLIDPIQFPEWQRDRTSGGAATYGGLPTDDDTIAVPPAGETDDKNEKEIPSPLMSRRRLIGIPGMSEKSGAIVMTKIDRIFNNPEDLAIDADKLEKNSCIETISPQHKRTFKDGVVYDFEEEPFYDKAVKDLFEMTNFALGSINNVFGSSKYFACSAIGCEPETREIRGKNELCFRRDRLNPIHVSDPIIWLLMEKRRKLKQKTT